MSPVTGVLIIACGIAAVLLLAWVLWTGFVLPWIYDRLIPSIDAMRVRLRHPRWFL